MAVLGLKGATVVIRSNNDGNYNWGSSGKCFNYLTRLPG